MDFKDYLQTHALQIEEELEKILQEFLNDTKKITPDLLPFALGLINSCKGGKRIRGALTILGYQIAGEETSQEIIKVGAAYEILHAAILIHDDIIDQSSTRRGQASLYKALGGGHYGISQALSLGDIGLYLPLKIITDLSFPDQEKIQALNHLSRTVINTAWGEILDLERNKDMILVNQLKTAQYTVCGPLILGAILAGAEEKLIRVLGEFGENLGIAYQIQDDILDGEKEPENREYSENMKLKALEYTNRGKKLIAQITSDRQMIRSLEQLTDFMIERSK